MSVARVAHVGIRSVGLPCPPFTDRLGFGTLAEDGVPSASFPSFFRVAASSLVVAPCIPCWMPAPSPPPSLASTQVQDRVRPGQEPYSCLVARAVRVASRHAGAFHPDRVRRCRRCGRGFLQSTGGIRCRGGGGALDAILVWSDVRCPMSDAGRVDLPRRVWAWLMPKVVRKHRHG